MTRSTWALVVVVGIVTIPFVVAAVLPPRVHRPGACADGSRAVYMRQRDIPTARVVGDTVTITPTDPDMVRVTPDSQWFDEAVTEPDQPQDGGFVCAPVSKNYRVKIVVPVPVPVPAVRHPITLS